MKPIDVQNADDPDENECGWQGYTKDWYSVRCAEASIDPSDAWALDTCSGFDAQARVEKVSIHWVKWRHTNPCANCVGLVWAQFSPELHVCSNIYNPADSSYAMVAASMGVESSVADIMNHSTAIFPGLTCEASSGSPSGTPQITFCLFEQRLTIPFSASSGPVDVGLIKPAPRPRYYNVTPATNWTIQFSFAAGVGFDVYANGWPLDFASGWAFADNSSWGMSVELACCTWNPGGGCCGYSSNKKYDPWWSEEATEPNCESE